MTPKADLKTIYDRIWSGARDKALANNMACDLPPDIGETRWGLSLILRVPFLPGIAEICPSLIERAGTGHFCYDSSNFHMTLRSIEGYRGDIPGGDQRALLYAERVAGVLPELRGLSIDLKGLTCGNSSVLVQGWPSIGLQAFRVALFRALEGIEISVPGGEISAERVRNTAHASLLLLNAPLADPAGFADFIDQNRDRNFGAFTPEVAELVFYRRTRRETFVETLASLPIN